MISQSSGFDAPGKPPLVALRQRMVGKNLFFVFFLSVWVGACVCVCVCVWVLVKRVAESLVRGNSLAITYLQ